LRKNRYIVCTSILNSYPDGTPHSQAERIKTQLYPAKNPPTAELSKRLAAGSIAIRQD